MKIVKLKGGLGNQMFQYAFAKKVEKETEDEVKIDLSAFANLKGDMVRKPRITNFNLSLENATKDDISQLCLLKHNGNSQTNGYRIKVALEALLNRKYCFERNHSGCSLEDLKKQTFFDGYWQDCAMVDSIMSELEKDFTPIREVTEACKEKLEYINRVNSVFLGVRRGDYLTNVSHYGSFSQKYYDDAMEIIAERVDKPVFFIFSNDIKWVQKNMDFSKYNIVFITDTVDDFEDFILMSNCKHSIITNSTYHWWGARRNEYPGKIIVSPKKWFADDSPINILPKRWIKVSN